MSQVVDLNEVGGGGGMGIFGGGSGGGVAMGVLLAALLGRRGLGGDGGDCDKRGDVFDATILSKLGNIEGAVPLSTAAIQAAICAAEGNFTGEIGRLALGTQSAISGVKDAVQNGTAFLATEILKSGCDVKSTVMNDGEKTRALLTSRFQLEDATKINELNAAVIELRSERRSADHARAVEVNVAQTVNQNQQQLQAQAQVQLFADLAAQVRNLANDIQVVRATQSNINFGVQAGTSQASNATNNSVR